MLDTRSESGLPANGDRGDRASRDRDISFDEAVETNSRDRDAEPMADRDDTRTIEDGDRRGAPAEADGDGERPRRRRRGRRGGRGRGRGDRVEASGDRGSGTGSDRVRVADAGLDEEPLPTSYGMRPAGRGDEPAGDRERPQTSRSDEEGSGTRGRRRRRRRGSEGRTGGGEGRAAAPSARERGSSSREGRRDRRGRSRGDSEPRPSGYSRGRRSDFTPVAGNYDEDDEGLEFLGVEEAGREGVRRESRADDEVLAESGLSSVRDVPSWVEAIGIVIAGNLDARSRSGRQEGRGR